MKTTILALTLLWEAGGSPADLNHVGSVAWNRWESGRYGNSIEEVCLYPRAFSCWNRREKTARAIRRYAKTEAEADPELWMRCLQLAMRIEEGEFDPTTEANTYWQHDARGVTRAMLALPEVARTRAHTYRKEE